MARLTVVNEFSFSSGYIEEFVDNLDEGTVVKSNDDLWRVSFGSDGEVFIRGNNLTYDNSDQLISGDITSFSFNQGGESPGEYGPALVRIRGLDNLSGADVHSVVQSEDTAAFTSVLKEAFKHDDVMKGANEADYLYGFDGADKIDGNGRGDELFGGHGADHLDGGGGADYLDGGKGKDRIFGGGDAETGDGKADTFAFAYGDSGNNEDHADRIYDFVSGTDFINLGRTGAHESEVHFKTENEHGNTKITIDAHDGQEKMVILVIGNDHVSSSDVMLGL